MPIYEYECPSCGCFEHAQSIRDPALERCPKCRRKVQRLISATSFQLKGGGWYSDGYHRSASTPKDASGEAKSGGDTSAAGDSKAQGAGVSESKKAESGVPPAATPAASKPKKAKASTTTSAD